MGNILSTKYFILSSLRVLLVIFSAEFNYVSKQRNITYYSCNYYYALIVLCFSQYIMSAQKAPFLFEVSHKCEQ